MTETEQTSLPLPRVKPVKLPVAGIEDFFGVRRIYCVGRNYLEHILEMKEGEIHDPPFFFQKPTDALVTDGKVPYPLRTDDFQYEVELVVGIGKTGRNVSVEDALNLVYGYAVGLDLTRRDRQKESFAKGLPWEIGKSFDYSAPCGPIHPVTQVGHRLSGKITLDVNGQTRQNSIIEKMIWDVPNIISQLSSQYTLEPGDLIFTGTPEGVSPIHIGDRLEGRVEGLEPVIVEILPRQ